ncbi:MAG: hypothetical protein P4L40_23090 [Terracidiphilus sp.]|nr:hypothetical protein [Terracidiphilus sp.]
MSVFVRAVGFLHQLAQAHASEDDTLAQLRVSALCLCVCVCVCVCGFFAMQPASPPVARRC